MRAECKGFFHKSLFFMGEFGVNDYSFSVFGKTPLEVRSMVPDVVKTISSATEVSRAKLERNGEMCHMLVLLTLDQI